MLYSSIRKRVVSGWMKQHHTQEFSSSLKLQKFLFFYEGLSKIENEPTEFRSLKGYINGPVFGDVYGDYTYENSEFFADVDNSYQSRPEMVNVDRAKVAGFLVKIMNENELSNLTHEFNIWKCKEDNIIRGERNVVLHEEDFNDSDKELLLSLKSMYPIDYIESVIVIQISGKSFVINKEDIPKLTDEQKRVFITLANNNNLQNPVYITVSDDGVILVD
jgi:hypothetical protein